MKLKILVIAGSERSNASNYFFVFYEVHVVCSYVNRHHVDNTVITSIGAGFY